MNLPDIIEWLPRTPCAFCKEPAVVLYMSVDGECLYVCKQHARTNAIEICMPERIEAIHCMKDSIIEMSETHFHTKRYMYVGVLA